MCSSLVTRMCLWLNLGHISNLGAIVGTAFYSRIWAVGRGGVGGGWGQREGVGRWLPQCRAEVG